MTISLKSEIYFCTDYDKKLYVSLMVIILYTTIHITLIPLDL